MAAAAFGTVPGMERLTQLTTFGVNQMSAGGYHGSSYAVLSGNELLFNLVEDAAATGFVLARGHRPFHIDGIDSSGNKIFSIRRELQMMTDKVELHMNGALVCSVRMEVTFMKPIFSIIDAQERQVLRVKGQFGETSRFRIQTIPKADIGFIDKRWVNWGRALTNLPNDYVITVPADLAVQLKLAVIATCVFVDARFMEARTTR